MLNLKKLLGIISVVIIVVFSMMLTTSYAWYSFGNASTVFEGMTNNDDIIVSYRTDEYINTTIAIPISSSDIAKYSDKNNFSIDVKNNVKDTEIAVRISLTEVNIDGALKDYDFKFDLYHQDTLIDENSSSDCINSTMCGAQFTTGNTRTLGTVVLDNNVTNNFELRIYLLDDGYEQGSYNDKDNDGVQDLESQETDDSGMMNKTFSAKIKIEVVSRLKNTIDDWTGADIYISSITIDGETSNYIPVDGTYDMAYTCTKGSNLEWDTGTKTITYTGGSYINDSCSLVFTTSTNYKYLKDMPIGSYVQYVGNNGCSGKACEGQNANYVSDTDMGYCNSPNSKFYVNGWRIGYIEDNNDTNASNDNAVLVSAGAPECVRTYVDSKDITTSSQTLSTDYYYGTGYKFDNTTGTFILTGVTDNVVDWATEYQNIIANTPYTCKKTSATDTCSTLYEIISKSSNTSGSVYAHYNYAYTNADLVKYHIANLNKAALKYCNSDYIKGGGCGIGVAHAMDAEDFQKITDSVLSSNSCYVSNCNMDCGYAKDLIDNGGYYWFATPYDASSSNSFSWYPNYRAVFDNSSIRLYGLRPVLNLESSVIVVGGKGTYKSPYIIDIIEE